MNRMKHRMKIYCPDCLRLVGHQNVELKSGVTRVVCGRCGRPLYDFDGNVWVYLRDVREIAD